MSVTVSALSDLLKLHQGDRKVREIGRACMKYGIGESTVIPYFNGKHGVNPPEEVLYALSQVMPLDIAELREAAGVPRGESYPYSPPAEFNRLSHAQRTALDEFVRSFVGPEGHTHAVRTVTTETAPPGAPAQAGPPEKTGTSPDDAQVTAATEGLESTIAAVTSDLHVENRDHGG